jgi:hypothetical protein
MEDKKFKDAMKAKEKEMKDEKEADRQVRLEFVPCEKKKLLTSCSGGYKVSKTSERLKLRRSATRSSQKRCIERGSSGYGGGRRGIRCSSPECAYFTML